MANNPLQDSDELITTLVDGDFTDEQISSKIAQLLKSEDIQAEVEIVYQSLEGLHKACPNHPGDWYFSGNYPTPGGYRLLNRAYIDYYENEYLKQK